MSDENLRVRHDELFVLDRAQMCDLQTRLDDFAKRRADPDETLNARRYVIMYPATMFEIADDDQMVKRIPTNNEVPLNASDSDPG